MMNTLAIQKGFLYIAMVQHLMRPIRLCPSMLPLPYLESPHLSPPFIFPISKLHATSMEEIFSNELTPFSILFVQQQIIHDFPRMNLLMAVNRCGSSQFSHIFIELVHSNFSSSQSLPPALCITASVGVGAGDWTIGRTTNVGAASKAACIVVVPSWLELFQPFLSLSLCCAVSNTCCLFLFLLIFVHLGILLVFYFCAMSFRNRKYESGFIFEQCLLFFKL